MATAITALSPRAPRSVGPGYPAAVAVGLVLGLVLWWSVPSLAAPSYGPPPALSESRILELKAASVHTSRIVGVDVRGFAAGSEVRLVGAYMDAQQIVLFLRSDPPMRPAPGSIALHDQFGRSYFSRAQFDDLAVGEHIVYFAAPRFPLLQTGARLTFEAGAFDRGFAPERTVAPLSLSVVVVANDPTVGAYLLDVTINYSVLLILGAVYLGVAILTLRALPVAPATRRAALRGTAVGVAFAAIALPTYIAVAFLFRHEPFGPGGLQRPPEAYVPGAQVSFYAIQLLAIAAGAFWASQIRGGRGATLEAAGLVILFLVLIQPLAEFANACYVGVSFLLESSC